MDVMYKLTPRDLSAYRYAVRDRLEVLPSASVLGKKWFQLLVVCAAGAIFVFVLDWLLRRVSGRPIEIVDFVGGMLGAVMMVLAVLWFNYSERVRKLVRDDGPTLAEHNMNVSPSGIKISAPHITAHYAWPAIQYVSVVRDLVIFWLEPAHGIAVPASAFANSIERERFVAAIEGHRKEAGLPRASSFSSE